MHFTKTIAAAFALTAAVSALPLQKRQDNAAIGNPNSVFLLRHPFYPLPTASLVAIATYLLPSSLYLDQDMEIKLTHISDILDDLLTNIQGGLRGGLDFLSIPSGSGAKKAKRADSGAANPLVDLGENVEGGVEGFLDFLGTSSD
ncbi:hypothetical protein M436DRAFT_59856 [Aureobasidium namibiae CBS 147.97]|uniref:Uncharacterized protein n=1 Tax=Aureobasidium namibiae CBS 147.97 TaxID=1043004 RepID=A0A074X296_9PEZI